MDSWTLLHKLLSAAKKRAERIDDRIIEFTITVRVRTENYSVTTILYAHRKKEIPQVVIVATNGELKPIIRFLREYLGLDSKNTLEHKLQALDKAREEVDLLTEEILLLRELDEATDVDESSIDPFTLDSTEDYDFD